MRPFSVSKSFRAIRSSAYSSRCQPVTRHSGASAVTTSPPSSQLTSQLKTFRPCRSQNTFSTSSVRPLTTVPPSNHATEPSGLSISEYHKRADTYIDALVAELEELQEEREDVDVEYSAGVLTLIFPPLGTYVLNKQPPNKQIWLSSPVSGPKRYDYVSPADGGGDGAGEWVYLRDGSTLSGLLRTEVGVGLELA